MGVPTPGARVGGTALPIPMLVEDLGQDARFDIRILAYGRWEENEPLAVKVVHQIVDLLRYPLRLHRARPDLVHLHSSFDRKTIVRDLAFGALTRVAGRPLLVEWHGAEVDLLHHRSLLWRAGSRLLLRVTSALAVLADEVRTELARTGFDKPCFLVKNPIDLARFTRPVDLRRRWGIEPSAPLLLFISRLISTKGLLDVIDAMSRLSAQEAHLLVVGDGPERQPAEARTQQLGLAKRIHFTGQVQEAEAVDFYCGCDVLVLPTYAAEGFPMSIFQAVAAGQGIITTRIRAAADHLTEPDHCLFVPPRDPVAIAHAIDRLLSDPHLLASMRRNNRDLGPRFERRRVAGEFGDIYLQMAEGVRARRDARALPSAHRGAKATGVR